MKARLTVLADWLRRPLITVCVNASMMSGAA